MNTDVSTYVQPNMRLLARDDLQRDIIASNRRLMSDFNLPQHALKNAEEIREIVNNTEDTVYKYHGRSVQKYLETILTFIIFLTDQSLSEDALLFRFIINTKQMDDMYLNPQCAELMFSDMVYSSAKPLQKYDLMQKIIQQIRGRVPKIWDDYRNNSNSFNLAPLDYRVPSELGRCMRVYREGQLESIFNILQQRRHPHNSSSSSSDESSSDPDDSSSNDDDYSSASSSSSEGDALPRLFNSSPSSSRSSSPSSARSVASLKSRGKASERDTTEDELYAVLNAESTADQDVMSLQSSRSSSSGKSRGSWKYEDDDYNSDNSNKYGELLSDDVKQEQFLYLQDKEELDDEGEEDSDDSDEDDDDKSAIIKLITAIDDDPSRRGAVVVVDDDGNAVSSSVKSPVSVKPVSNSSSRASSVSRASSLDSRISSILSSAPSDEAPDADDGVVVISPPSRTPSVVSRLSSILSTPPSRASSPSPSLALSSVVSASSSRTPSPSPTLPMSVKSSVYSTSSSSPTCHQCKIGNFKHSYRTPLYDGEKTKFAHFCGDQCMEDWDIPKYKPT